MRKLLGVAATAAILVFAAAAICADGTSAVSDKTGKMVANSHRPRYEQCRKTGVICVS